MQTSLRTLSIALAALALSAISLGAQEPARALSFAAEAGPSFPTGGDFNDVYKAGYHAGLSVEHALAPRLALRASADCDIFGHDTIKPQYGEDPQWGKSFYTTADAVLRGPGRFYVLGGVGYYRVHAAFLALDGHVLPAATQQAIGLDGGFGVRLNGGWQLEIRHHDALRRREGIARWIPIMLRRSL